VNVTERLRVGIVGCGAVARLHMQAYREVPGIALAAVADTNGAALQRASHELQVPGYENLDAMFEAQPLDIVAVLTPPASHEALVTRAARAGVHVLCEKPLSLSVESCQNMIDACRENQVRLCYGASYRYLPALIAARRIILDGEIGKVLLLREYAVGGLATAKRGTLGFSHYPQGGPGGSGMGLCDHGIHLIDAFPWLLNSRTVGAWGRGNVSGAEQRPEFAHLEYENGAFGDLLYEDGTYATTLPQEGLFAWGGGWSVGASAGESAPAGSWDANAGCIHVHGDRGSLRIYYYANRLFLRDSAGVREVRVPDRPVPSNFAMQLEAFVDAIQSNRATPVPGEVGLEACRTLLSVYAGTGAVKTARSAGGSHA
jgi:predicted dehydrogenase